MKMRDRLLLAATVGLLSANNATAQWVAEWFVDTDPGAGAANRVAFDPSNTDFQLPIPTGNLSPGTHIIGFRIGDQQFNAGMVDHKHYWSTTEIRHIYVLPKVDPNETLLGSYPITGGEWFVGKDPGTGKGASLSWAKTNTVHDWYGLSFQNLPEGLNTVGVRVQDSLGRWSATRFRNFVVVAGSAIPFDGSAPITGGEWFVGKDPGTGKGTSISWAKTDTVHDWYGLSFQNLPPGLNTVGVRVKDSLGRWSATRFRSFVVVAGARAGIDSSLPLTGGEWFFDRDPGTGKGISFTFDPSDSLRHRLSTSARALALGPHRVSFRVRDAAGRWSATLSAPFVVAKAPVLRDTTLSMLEDSTGVLGERSFAWSSDKTGDTLQKLVVAKLPVKGALVMAGKAVAVGDSIDVERLRAGGLSYRPQADANGLPLDTMQFAVVIDSLLSNAAGVRMNVIAVNDAPIVLIKPTVDTLFAGQSWSMRWQAKDADGDSLRLVKVTLPSWLAAGDDGASLLKVGQPAPGRHPIELRLTDGSDTILLVRDTIVVNGAVTTGLTAPPKRLAVPASSLILVRPVVAEASRPGAEGVIRKLVSEQSSCRGIRIRTARHESVSITIYDNLGTRVVAWSEQQSDGGEHWLDWNLNSSSGRAVTSGVYIWEVRIKNHKTGEQRQEYLLQGVKRP